MSFSSELLSLSLYETFRESFQKPLKKLSNKKAKVAN